jgi:hypothetical protein
MTLFDALDAMPGAQFVVFAAGTRSGAVPQKRWS